MDSANSVNSVNGDDQEVSAGFASIHTPVSSLNVVLLTNPELRRSLLPEFIEDYKDLPDKSNLALVKHLDEFLEYTEHLSVVSVQIKLTTNGRFHPQEDTYNLPRPRHIFDHDNRSIKNKLINANQIDITVYTNDTAYFPEDVQRQFIEYTASHSPIPSLIEGLHLQALDRFPNMESEQLKLEKMETEKEKKARLDRYIDIFQRLHFVMVDYSKPETHKTILNGIEFLQGDLMRKIIEVDQIKLGKNRRQCDWHTDMIDFERSHVAACLMTEPRRRGLRSNTWHVASYVEFSMRRDFDKTMNKSVVELHIEFSCTNPVIEGFGLSELLRAALIKMAADFGNIDMVTTQAVAGASQYLSQKLGFRPEYIHFVFGKNPPELPATFPNLHIGLGNHILSLHAETETFKLFQQAWKKYNVLLVNAAVLLVNAPEAEDFQDVEDAEAERGEAAERAKLKRNRIDPQWGLGRKW